MNKFKLLHEKLFSEKSKEFYKKSIFIAGSIVPNKKETTRKNDV
jgi:hypothetical protein